MSETIVRKSPFQPTRPAGGFVIVSASGVHLATGTERELNARLDMYGEGARVEPRGKR